MLKPNEPNPRSKANQTSCRDKNLSSFKIFNKRRFVLDIVFMALIAFLILLKQLLSSGLPAGTDSFGYLARIVYLSKNFRWLYLWKPYGFGFVEHINLIDFIIIGI